MIDPALDLAARLRRAASDRPDHLALVHRGGRLTYGQLHRRVDDAAAALQDLGIEAGDRVGLVLGTTPTFVEAALATLRAGAIVVPLLPALAPDELRHALADSGASVVVAGPERHADLAALRDGLPELRHLVAADGASEADARGATDVEALGWDALLGAAGAPTLPERRKEDVAALVYTSGTTGRPRGAVLTRGNLAANQDQSLAGRFAVGPDDVVLVVLPLAHIYAFNVGLGASLSAAATIVLAERFDPAASLAVIAEHRVSVVLGAPPMYIAWLGSGALEGADLSSVRLAVSGAAPLPVPVIERFAALTGIDIEEGYGLTEAAPSVSSTAMGPTPRPGSVGLPLPGIEVRLVDARGQEAEVGDPGEVWVRGPNVTAGYWRDEEATREILTADGWLRTGDVATRDEDGYLYLVDRLRDVVIVSGFNVYPGEVERVLHEDETVAEAGVVGVPDPLTGEAVLAHVVPRHGATVDPQALLQRCRRRLARYKCPARIEVVDHLPYTATGKLRRRALREGADHAAASAGAGQDRP